MICTLCPRECGVSRENGDYGFCGVPSEIILAAILPHFGEEPCITGKNGSGTVFFSGCSCGCFFCQNYQISHEFYGKSISQEQFVQKLKELIARGVHNLNFVTPDHYWHQIKPACEQLRDEGFDIPFLWNSSGYSKIEHVREQVRLIDVFLPDFKFTLPALAEQCIGDSRYPDIALKAITEMVDATGFLRPYDPSGELTATRGTLVRHLVLPGQLDNSIKALDTLYSHFGPLLPISIMSQFQPMPECHKRHLFETKVAPELYQQVCDYAEELGFVRIFRQLDGGDDAYAPDFTKENPFPAPRKSQNQEK